LLGYWNAKSVQSDILLTRRSCATPNDLGDTDTQRWIARTYTVGYATTKV